MIETDLLVSDSADKWGVQQTFGLPWSLLHKVIITTLLQ